ncbi:TolC family protein [Chitinophagaceae bacterium LB-8]|uniref:TolC family protein n=1 Tax=Paraflavisolibacter caeni TaxID=2982496 RepID=A0A9X2XTJ8_9BACT|nr:TolC family protein [Paraflavisolibacter caeni]MCU7548756.1 TolC family protein [Paraflavisolibacter caeni]
MENKHLKLLSVLCFLLFTTLANAQQKYELTVEEAIELAFKNVMQLKNAQADYRIQEAKNKEIFGQALPQVTGDATAQHYLKVPQFLFPNATDNRIYTILKEEGVSGSGGPITKVPEVTYAQVSFQQPWNLTLGATVTQLLFQPDVFVGLQARETALNFSAAQIEQVKVDIKDSAYKRYYAIIIAEKQLHFLNEGVKRLEKLYNDDSIMYKNGFAEKLDLDKVQVQLTNLKTQQNWTATAIRMAYASLKFVLGVSQKDTLVLKNDLTLANVKEGILDESFKYEDRPEIQTLNYAKRLQELDLKRYRLRYFPTVTLLGNYGVTGMGPKFYTDPSTIWLKSSYVGLNVNLPIFDGTQRRYRIQQSQLNVEKAENTINSVKQAIDFEQVFTKESMKNALVNLDLQEHNMQLAERVYNATKIKFEQGVGSSFEVLQADTDYQTAQSNFFTALYNATLARISYLKSLGKL